MMAEDQVIPSVGSTFFSLIPFSYLKSLLNIPCIEYELKWREIWNLRILMRRERFKLLDFVAFHVKKGKQSP